MALTPPGSLPTSGTVERVVDGDTLVLHRLGRVRLIGVDTPEPKDSRKEVQELARESSAFLRRLAAGQVVRMEYDNRTRDRYGRLLAYLYLPDGRCINAEIIRQQGTASPILATPFHTWTATGRWSERRGWRSVDCGPDGEAQRADCRQVLEVDRHGGTAVTD